MEEKKVKKGMNLPNRLTVMRLILVPAILVFMLLPYSILNNIIALVIFSVASFTDYLDGHLARKYNLITDFGKFLDPLADKFMVIAAVFGIIWRYRDGVHAYMFEVFMIMMIVTIFRELAVASLRLITVQNAGVVVAANKLGKIKTVTQMICIILALVEPVVHDIIGNITGDFFFYGFYGLTLIFAVLAIIFTIWSGLVYIVKLWKYMSPDK